jgi:protein-disulfide isomerase
MSRIVSLIAVAVLATACGSAQKAGNKESAAASTAAPSGDPKAPVAKYEGGTVTAGELDEATKSEMKQLDAEHEKRVYELRRSTLDRLILERLFEERAKKEGMKLEEYLQREITASAPAPTDADLQQFYDRQVQQAKAQTPPYEAVKEQIRQQLAQQGAKNPTEKELRAFYDERTTPPPFAAVKDQLRDALVNERAQQAAGNYLQKARTDAKVQILLQPKRTEVAAEGPTKGPADAPITIVEFSDFECPFCVRAEESIAQVMKAYEGKVRIVYRDFPLPNHTKAPKAAEAAHCAGDQGKYWEMHSTLFKNQRAIDVPALKGYAKELGLDTAKFDQCLDSGAKANVVAEHKKAGEAAGVTGTPAFFINGVFLNGAQPFEAFKEIIDSELSRGTATAQK